MRIHLTEDAQIVIALVGGWMGASLNVCRLKYGKGWFDPWLAMSRVAGVIALGLIAENERAMICAWWAAAPVLASTCLLSAGAWLTTIWILRQKSQSTILELGLVSGSERAAGKAKRLAPWLCYWGMTSVALLVASFATAAARIR